VYFCDGSDKPQACLSNREFIDQLYSYQLLKQNSVPQTSW